MDYDIDYKRFALQYCSMETLITIINIIPANTLEDVNIYSTAPTEELLLLLAQKFTLKVFTTWTQCEHDYLHYFPGIQVWKQPTQSKDFRSLRSISVLSWRYGSERGSLQFVSTSTYAIEVLNELLIRCDQFPIKELSITSNDIIPESTLQLLLTHHASRVTKLEVQITTEHEAHLMNLFTLLRECTALRYCCGSPSLFITTLKCMANGKSAKTLETIEWSQVEYSFHIALADIRLHLQQLPALVKLNIQWKESIMRYLEKIFQTSGVCK